MNRIKAFSSVLLLSSLWGCAHKNLPLNESQVGLTKEVVIPIQTESFVSPPSKVGENESEATIISHYYQHRVAMYSLSKGDPLPAENFLMIQPNAINAMVIEARLGLMRFFGERNNWDKFLYYYRLTSPEERSPEVICYASMAGAEPLKANALREVQSNEGLSRACNQMIILAARRSLLSEKDIWRRVRVLLSKSRFELAKKLVQAINQSLGENQSQLSGKARKISQLIPIITKKGRNRHDLEERLAQLYGLVDSDDIGFAEGIAGFSYARNLEMVSALQHFTRADISQLSHEEWEWYARAALRLSQWSKLKTVIGAMPQELRESPTWWYWLGRAETQLGDGLEAKRLYEKAASSGRNFYAILAQEELHKAVNVESNTDLPDMLAVENMRKNEAIHRALVLFRESLSQGDRGIRSAAQAQWRYAIQNFSGPQLLAAAQLATLQQFNEMSIHSADKSEELINFQLRFPLLYLDSIRYYAYKNGVELPWVLGLIRQESRFMAQAISSRGAIGLMQIMPASALHISKQMGLSTFHQQDLNSNIDMGTWYLAYLYRNLYSEPLATAAYNAGPIKAQLWRQPGLEGAIYVETIPFQETREYVKKVMTNTYYYSRLLNQSNRNLKERLGNI